MIYYCAGEEEAEFICAFWRREIFVIHSARDGCLVDLTLKCDLRHRERLEIVDIVGREESFLKVYYCNGDLV